MRALILDGEALLESEDVDEIQAHHAAGHNMWVNLGERSPNGERVLREVFHLHPLAIEDVWNDLDLPKIEDFGDYVHIIIHGVLESDRDAKDVPLELAELDVIIGRNFVITFAGERGCGVAPVREEVRRNARLLKRGPAWVAHAIMDHLVDEYIPVIDAFDDQLDTLEARILDEEGNEDEDREIMQRVLRIKRSLQRLRRTTSHQREILLRLARAEFDEIPKEAMPFYRDVYDHFARVTDLVDSYRELTTSMLEAHLSLQSNRMNEVMKRLTIISTIMLPLSLIAGIYGMNFKFMPELDVRAGYPAALGLMAVVATAILYWFRRKGWP